MNKNLEIFLDSASAEEIKSIDFIELDGITTNPSIAAKNIAKINSKKNKIEAYKDILKEICQIIQGPVSAEVISEDYESMISEALEFNKIAKNIIIKLPITKNGLIACRTLTQKYNIKTNMTLCFSSLQALAAAKNGATYVSPFIGRLDDGCFDGMSLIKDIRIIFDQYNLKTKILAASVRTLNHIIECLKIGVDAITVSKSLLSGIYKHNMTDVGMEIFKKDWNN
jgi:transaldolase